MADLPATDPLKPEDALAVVKALTEVSAVFLALTFVGGWSYLASYYRTFGLNPLELDLPTPVVSTLAIQVLYKPLWPLMIAAAVMALLALVARCLHHVKQGWVAALLIILLFAVVIAGAKRGRYTADRDMVLDTSSLPNVTFAAKTGVADFPCVEVETFGSSDCKLLLHSKATYYFFLPVSSGGEGSLNLYMLPDAEVVASHVLRGLDRNAR